MFSIENECSQEIFMVAASFNNNKCLIVMGDTRKFETIQYRY